MEELTYLSLLPKDVYKIVENYKRMKENEDIFLNSLITKLLTQLNWLGDDNIIHDINDVFINHKNELYIYKDYPYDYKIKGQITGNIIIIKKLMEIHLSLVNRDYFKNSLNKEMMDLGVPLFIDDKFKIIFVN